MLRATKGVRAAGVRCESGARLIHAAGLDGVVDAHDGRQVGVLHGHGRRALARRRLRARHHHAQHLAAAGATALRQAGRQGGARRKPPGMRALHARSATQAEAGWRSPHAAHAGRVYLDPARSAPISTTSYASLAGGDARAPASSPASTERRRGGPPLAARPRRGGGSGAPDRRMSRGAWRRAPRRAAPARSCCCPARRARRRSPPRRRPAPRAPYEAAL